MLIIGRLPRGALGRGTRYMKRQKARGRQAIQCLTTVLPMCREQSKLRLQKGMEARLWLWYPSLIQEAMKII